MKLQEKFQLFVSEDKIIRYLLENRQGRARDKSKLFSRFGYERVYDKLHLLLIGESLAHFF